MCTIPMGGKCTVDSAFAKVICQFLIKSSHNILVLSAQTTREQREKIQQKIQATSLKQAAEWGMRSIQSLFPKLKDKLVYEEGGEQ